MNILHDEIHENQTNESKKRFPKRKTFPGHNQTRTVICPLLFLTNPGCIHSRMYTSTYVISTGYNVLL